MTEWLQHIGPQINKRTIDGKKLGSKMMLSSTRAAGVVAGLTATSLLLTACGDSAQEDQNLGEGFAYGADQGTVDELISDMDPVHLTYQPTAASSASNSAASGIAFAEAVEERSGGKITMEMAWGQSIAPYGEIDDALTDGRLDIAFDVLIYSTDQYPVFDAMSTLSQVAPAASLVGETTTTAMLTELAWESDDLIDEFEEQGFEILAPVITAGQYYISCAEPLDTLSDWEGAQIRIGSTRQRELVESVGAAPVSMEYTDAYEALERGALDCAISPLTATGGFGINEVAPYFYHWDDTSSADAGQGAHLAGSRVQELPLAYQQILFDAFAEYFDGQMVGIMDSAVAAVSQAKEFGGSVQPLPSEVEGQMNEAQQQSFDELMAEGRLPPDSAAQAKEASDRWEEAVRDAGIEDQGSFGEVDEWYDGDEVDFTPLGETIYEEVLLDHRPE